MPSSMPWDAAVSASRGERGLVVSECVACRLGKLTVPCSISDVRALPNTLSTPDALMPYRNSIVQGEGPVPCDIMLIGEAPGFHEDREGLPFRGQAPAGRELNRALEVVGLVRGRDVFITNVVRCRPLDNKIDKFPDAVETCRALYLFQEIALVRPKVIVCLGKTAAQFWFGSQGALVMRQAHYEGADGEPVSCLFIHAPHPSSIARGNEDARPKLLMALAIAKEVGT